MKRGRSNEEEDEEEEEEYDDTNAAEVSRSSSERTSHDRFKGSVKKDEFDIGGKQDDGEVEVEAEEDEDTPPRRKPGAKRGRRGSGLGRPPGVGRGRRPSVSYHSMMTSQKDSMRETKKDRMADKSVDEEDEENDRDNKNSPDDDTGPSNKPKVQRVYRKREAKALLLNMLKKKKAMEAPAKPPVWNVFTESKEFIVSLNLLYFLY